MKCQRNLLHAKNPGEKLRQLFRRRGALFIFVFGVASLLLVKSSILKANNVADKVNIPYTLIGEAVGEGREGMQAVYEVMLNQSKFFNQPLDEVVRTKYAAWKRPDLEDFVYKQPQGLVEYAHDIVNEQPTGVTNGALHFENIKKFGIPDYAKKEGGIVPLATIGNHTFFITKREQGIINKKNQTLVKDTLAIARGKNANRP